MSGKALESGSVTRVCNKGNSSVSKQARYKCHVLLQVCLLSDGTGRSSAPAQPLQGLGHPSVLGEELANIAGIDTSECLSGGRQQQEHATKNE